MQLDKFIDGLKTLQPYYKDPNGYHLGAEHDEFYLYKTDRPLSAVDAKKMFALGWFQHEPETEDVYDPEAAWMLFT